MKISLFRKMHTSTDSHIYIFFLHIIPGGTRNTPKPRNGNSSSVLKSPIPVYGQPNGMRKGIFKCVDQQTTLKKKGSDLMGIA